MSFILGMVSAQVREGYISGAPPGPLQLLSNNSILLSLWIYFAFGVFCGISLHFLCLASPFPPHAPASHCIFVFSLNHWAAFCFQVSYYMFIHIKSLTGGGEEKKKVTSTSRCFSGSSAKWNTVGRVRCISAGFYGNYGAVFSAVVSLCPALCFRLGEEGRVRTVPRRAAQKVGQRLTSPSNQISQLEEGSWHEFFT